MTWWPRNCNGELALLPVERRRRKLPPHPLMLLQGRAGHHYDVRQTPYCCWLPCCCWRSCCCWHSYCCWYHCRSCYFHRLYRPCKVCFTVVNVPVDVGVSVVVFHCCCWLSLLLLSSLLALLLSSWCCLRSCCWCHPYCFCFSNVLQNKTYYINLLTVKYSSAWLTNIIIVYTLFDLPSVFKANIFPV